MARKTPQLKMVATGPQLPSPPDHLGDDGRALWSS
jgi:hypothetical protein